MRKTKPISGEVSSLKAVGSFVSRARAPLNRGQDARDTQGRDALATSPRNNGHALGRWGGVDVLRRASTMQSFGMNDQK
jgi:hypothetical protein